MYEKISELEYEVIDLKEVERLLELLEKNYFTEILENDALIIYNYRTFHESYASLLRAATDKLRSDLSKLKKKYYIIWEDCKKSEK